MRATVTSHTGGLRRLFPPIDPYDHGWLDTGDGHSVYWETSGNHYGRPVLFLHGGPGGATSPVQRRFFDPDAYRIILMDQRGCGRSTPHACLDHNTSWHLIDDVERLRKRLGVDKWLLFGGSWGSTLSLLYAQCHPDRVLGLILRGIFLSQQSEIDWFYRFGANRLFPEAWSQFEGHIPPAERRDLVAAYYRRLTDLDDSVVRAAARRWSQWERATVTLVADPRRGGADSDGFAKAIARIECHYFVNRGFLRQDDQILVDMPRIAHLPGVLIQGRYDVICPPVTAVTLAEAWPQAQLKLVPVAGHSAFEPDIVHELITATEAFKH